MPGLRYFFPLLLAVLGSAVAHGALQVSPLQIEFSDSFSQRQLLVEDAGRDATRSVEYLSENPDVARVDSRGLVVPTGIGVTRIVIRRGDESASVEVSVEAFDRHRPIDFTNEIEPLLTRYGCNSGGCHGKASGQNGFKLSLFGYDAEFDYQALVNEARGRRVFSQSPAQSLLLTKATGRVPHGGGKRFDVDSEAYEILLSWIVAGAPASNPDVPTTTGIRIEPSERVLSNEGSQQLRVIALYSDGSERDVTRQAEYSSNIDVVAKVDEQGYVEATGLSGEAAVMARYRGHVSVFLAVVPNGTPLAELSEFDPITEIDRLAVEKWKKLGLRPSPVTDDAAFLRRITIDVCGRLPTLDETRQFLADDSPDKREKLIDRLLASPDYPAYFALKWSVILRNSRLAGADQAAYAFHNWIKDNIARNRPYDEFVRGIVAASGEWQDAPAINWYWQARDDQLHIITADTAQLFLGIRLQCARCHHHPYERWGQEDYFGLAGFYTRLGRKSFGQPPPYYAAGNVTTGERNPLTGQVPKPKYPDGEYAEFTPEQDPRHALVDWMAKPDNPFFARAFVNRMWGHFFERGLVDEVDDLRATNPASNEAILDHLARDFVAHKFDMKHIIREIVRSRVYQLSSEPRPENEHDRQNFARFYARRMIAEVLHDAVDQACGTRTNFGNISSNARAVDLPHEGFGSYFLDTFDRPKRVTVCECERSSGATLAQVLLLANSDDVENKIAHGEGRLAKLFGDQKSIPALVEDLYLSAYTRFPTDEEKNLAVQYIEQRPETERRKAAEDLLWSLLNSREFMFNH